jgi:hypothetical protein
MKVNASEMNIILSVHSVRVSSRRTDLHTRRVVLPKSGIHTATRSAKQNRSANLVCSLLMSC